MKKRYIVGLLLCCLMIIPMVGCTTKTTTNTSTITPIQQLNISTAQRFESVWAVDNRQDADLTAHAVRIGALETATHVDLTPLTNRVTTLEGLNLSNLAAMVAYINLWIADYETENISTRLTAVEARLSATPTPIPSATPNASATPTPTIPCALKPDDPTPSNANTSINSSEVVLSWSDCFSGSDGTYYVYLSINDNFTNMSLVAITQLTQYYANGDGIYPNSYYAWRVTAVSPCGNKSSSWWFKTQ
jgi:hypothetical protein